MILCVFLFTQCTDFFSVLFNIPDDEARKFENSEFICKIKDTQSLKSSIVVISRLQQYLDVMWKFA